MEFYYTDEKNHQILISLLKQKHIRYAVASPGTTNVSLVESLQHDPFFSVYSCVDERSAAYMACGIAEESGEPVVLTCTGATASRNYYPGLTEAYYRKLPVLAVTSTQARERVGQLVPQVIDRSVIANDVSCYHTILRTVYTSEQYRACEVECNQALIELRKDGGGPVHIDLETTYSRNYSVRALPKARNIEYYTYKHELPLLKADRVAVLIGSHCRISSQLTSAIEAFCELYNGAVLCDHTSGYQGKYKVLPAIIGAQENLSMASLQPTLTIHIGEVSGDYDGNSLVGGPVWRISEDGRLKDPFNRLVKLFDLSPTYFFRYYTRHASSAPGAAPAYFRQLDAIAKSIREMIPELPFSNLYIARKLSSRIPTGSRVNFGILNSLRSWNMFPLPLGVKSSSNVGGFGIDGGLSTTAGASLASPDKLHFIVIGDLAFFYDMNVLGNHHLGNNLRILLINNGVGTEFKNYNHRCAEFGDDGDPYMAARGHFGNRSSRLVKHYAEDLGFDYISAISKEEFNQVFQRFTAPLSASDRSIIFEVFTTSEDESSALYSVKHLRSSLKTILMRRGEKILNATVGRSLTSKIKRLIKR